MGVPNWYPVDSRERNLNTQRMASPLPDIEGILNNVARHRYWSLLDSRDAFEQIRVIPEHEDRTQTIMNHIFAPYIGKFMEVYLDDLVIYSDTPERKEAFLLR